MNLTLSSRHLIRNAVLVASCVFTISSHAQLILDTDFTANSQALPTNSRWIRNSTGFAMAFNQPGLKVTPNNNAQESLTYLTSTGNVLTLDVNEKITLSFTANGVGLTSAGSGFRFGLFDSNGSTRENSTAAFQAQAYSGYFLSTNLRTGSAGSTGLIARDPALNISTLINSNSLGTPATNLSSADGPGLATTASFDGWISITNLGVGGTLIEYGIGTIGGSYTDTTFNFTSFDTIGLAVRNSQAPNGITFSHMTVEIATVPEPHTVALLALGGSFIVLRRRAARA